MWTDTHAHLADPSIQSILPQVLERAAQAHVTRILCVGVDVETSRAAIGFAERYPMVWASVGIHPNYAHQCGASDWDQIREFTQHERVCALGETGLDRHWDDCPFELQKMNFARHIELSFECALPLIVHMRDCEAEMIEFLRSQAQRRPLHGVMHSFTGTTETAAACMEFGLHISFAGMLTYKKSELLRETARTIPLSRLLVETDSPYLSPEPVRGQRPNEPAHVVHTGQLLAKLHAVSDLQLAETTTRNAMKLFARMP